MRCRSRQVEEQDQWESLRTDVQKLRDINEQQEKALLAAHDAKQVEAAQRHMAERGRTEAVSALARLSSLTTVTTPVEIANFHANLRPVSVESTATSLMSANQEESTDGGALYAARPGGGLNGARREPASGYHHVSSTAKC
eukprot:COSAG05_NODE_577_length_8579_cov_1071.651651_5_plen_141_part_00